MKIFTENGYIKFQEERSNTLISFYPDVNRLRPSIAMLEDIYKNLMTEHLNSDFKSKKFFFIIAFMKVFY